MWLLFLLSCLVLGVDACSTDADCTGGNEECYFGSCQCVDGFENVTSSCTKVLGKNCILQSDCSMITHSVCSGGLCVCDSTNSYYESGDICVTVIGRACTDEVECLNHHHVSCRDGQCKCYAGYEKNGDFCSSISCSSDSDCTDENTNCTDWGYCDCTDGYSHENGLCTTVLGRECGTSTSDWYWCHTYHGTDMFECSGGTCACSYTHYEDDGSCLPILGKSCQDDSDCESSTRYYGTPNGVHCYNNTCQCTDSHYESGEYCSSYIYSSCTDDTDCPLEFSNCSIYYYSSSYSYGRCRCIDGAFLDYNDYFCKPEIGQPCSSSYTCNYAPKYCNAEDICTCGFGKVNSEDLLSCVSVYNTPCSSTSDCIDTSTYTCEAGLCLCSEAYTEHGFDDYWGVDIPCVKSIGLSCNVTNCDLDNAECDEDNECACMTGFIEDDGYCIQGIGATCHHDVVCTSFDDNAKCAQDNTCQCKDGFVFNDDSCFEVLGSSCASDNDCVGITKTVCSTGICACAVGFDKTNNQCFSGVCSQAVPKLPNIFRRTQQHTLDFPNEQALNDQDLEEGWYSLGGNQPLVNPTVISKGDCGTVYPIYIDTLTQEQIEELDETGINVGAVVAGLDEYDITESFDVGLRKCGNDFQLRVVRPNTALSAYCIGGQATLTTRPRETPRVTSELRFSNYVDGGGVRYDPYLVFQCDLRPYHWGYSYAHSQYYGKYYIVNWYTDNNHLVSYGPATWEYVNTTTFLNESTLLDMGFSIGVQIQCSYQQMDRITSAVSLQKFSTNLDTNIKMRQTVMYMRGHSNYYFSPKLSVPLGCSSYNTDDFNLCKYRLGAVVGGSSECPTSQNDHEMCGFYVNATSYQGSFEQLNEYYWDIMNYEIQTFDIFYDSDGQLNKEYIRSNLSLPSDLDQYDSYRPFRFKVHVDNNGWNIDHPIWNGYVMDDMKIYPQPGYGSGQRVEFSSGWIHWNFWSSSVQMPPITPGEYILYRSSHLPVEIQGRGQISGTGIVELCGLAIRSGNAIRLESFCDGVNITASIGNLRWDDDSVYEKTMYFDNGLFFGVYQYYGSMNSFYFVGFTSVFENAEGLATISEGYNLRDGTASTSELNFFNSWKITAEESLWNPSNQRSFTYTEATYLCGCPPDSTNATGRIEDFGTEIVTHYNGIIECTVDYPCEEEINGTDQWADSLLPNYVVNDVNISVEAVYSTDNIPSLIFRCDFDTATGFFYKALWIVDRHVVVETSILPADDFQNYGVTDSELVAVTENMYLNSEIACGVSVYSGTSEDNQLLPFKNSSEIIPIQMDTNRFYLTRAGRTTFRLERNIPLPCSGSACWANIKVIDPLDDSKCKNSSIAVISNTMCGHIVFGTSEEVSNFESETIELTLTTIYSRTYKLRTFYNLTLALEVVGQATPFWGLDFNSTLLGYIVDNLIWQGRRCYVNNDPRAGTSDGIHFYHYPLGEYIYYKHKQYNMQIQVKMMECGNQWWSATCSCAVTLQAGLDVYTVNHCDGNHYVGFLSNDTEVLLANETMDSYRTRVVLPTGTVADIRYSPWNDYIVNLDIFPSPSDVEATEGLCGNFNGDRSDDIRHRDGTQQTVNSWWWWYYYGELDDFMESWRVDASESLLSPTVTDTLQGWNVVNEMKCVCPQLPGFSLLVCGANELSICRTTSGTSTNASSRRKRSLARTEELYRKLATKPTDFDRRRRVKRSTGTNMTFEEALTICNDSLTSNCGQFGLSSALNETGLNITTLVEDCARDVQLRPDTDWADDTCGVITVVADVELSLNESFQEANPDVYQAYLAIKCPGKSNCSGNGLCSNGVCVCLEGYGSEDCYLLLSIPPNIESIEGNGTCDTSTETDCHCVMITTNGTAANATCAITVSEIGENGTTVDNNSTYSVNVTSANFNEVQCCVPSDTGSTRRKRSTGTPSIAQVYTVSLSNDGQHYGTPVQMYILDTTCQQMTNDTNGTTIILLKSGYCYIDGSCVQNYTKLNNESCLVCMPDANAFQWTEDGCPTTIAPDPTNNNGGSDDDDDNLMLIIVLVSVFSVVLCIGVGVLIYFAYKHSKRLNRLGAHPNIPEPPPHYFDSTPHGHFHGADGSRKFAYN